MKSPPLGIELNEVWVTSWAGNWVDGDVYYNGQIVLDGDWLMVATATTDERPAPQPLGSPVYLYDGTNPTTSVAAKQIIQGAVYSASVPIFVSGFRMYVVAGNLYRIYSVDANGSTRQIAILEATVTGWVENPLPLSIVPSGTTFAIYTITTEPDPSPTTFVGNWDYQTPQNTAIPASGQIVHARGTNFEMRIHKTDDDLVDRSAELALLGVGDIIDGAGVRWSIQSVTDNGTYLTFVVAPAQNGTPTGVQSFTFETVAPTPISYLKDVDFYLTNAAVSGLEGVDVPFEDIVPDNNAYGVDILVQPASVPSNWELLAYTGSGVGGGSTPTTDVRFFDAGDQSGTWTPDLTNGLNQTANATGTTLLEPPTGTDGQTGQLLLTVNGQTITFGSGWIWGDSTVPDPTGATRLLISYVVDPTGNVVGTGMNLAS